MAENLGVSLLAMREASSLSARDDQISLPFSNRRTPIAPSMPSQTQNRPSFE